MQHGTSHYFTSIQNKSLNDKEKKKWETKFNVNDLNNIKNSNENHKPWLPKYFDKYIDTIIKETTEIIMAFLISFVCVAPINIPSS